MGGRKFSVALFVPFDINSFIVKIQNRKSKFTKSKPAKVPPKKTGAESAATAPEAEALSPLIEVPDPKAFLEEAKKESKRKLISDYSDTITVLRNEKRFTFRAIADWLSLASQTGC